MISAVHAPTSSSASSLAKVACSSAAGSAAPPAHEQIPGNPFIHTPLSPNEAAQVLEAAGPLDDDPSCNGLSNRKKSIGFFVCFSGHWLQLDKRSFIDERSRPISGECTDSVEHFYSKLPPQFVACDATRRVLDAFRDRYAVPDGAPILVQVQSLDVLPHEEGKYLTGQAAHTDGANNAMIVCLSRRNVGGARNALFRDLGASKAVVPPFELSVGEAVMWDDNRVYHMVEPMRPLDASRPSNRTIMLAHYPATHYITGGPNPNNNLMDVEQYGGKRSYVCFHFGGFSSFASGIESAFSETNKPAL